MSTEGTSAAARLFEAVQKPVHFFSVTAFFWDVGKHLVEGWHSVTGFILHLPLLLGWILIPAYVVPFAILLLPPFLPALAVLGLMSLKTTPGSLSFGNLLMFLGIVAVSFGGGAVIIKSQANKKYMEAVFELFFKRIAKYYFPACVAIGILLSTGLHPSADHISAITLLGWLGIIAAVMLLMGHLQEKRAKRKEAEALANPAPPSSVPKPPGGPIISTSRPAMRILGYAAWGGCLGALLGVLILAAPAVLQAASEYIGHEIGRVREAFATKGFLAGLGFAVGSVVSAIFLGSIVALSAGLKSVAATSPFPILILALLGALSGALFSAFQGYRGNALKSKTQSPPE